MIEGIKNMAEQVSMFDFTLCKGDKARVKLYSNEVPYAPRHYFEVCEIKSENIDWCTVEFPTGEIEKFDTSKLIPV